MYPRRRSCGYPQQVYDNTPKNATGAKLAANGFDLGQAVTGGIPFPNPANGAEAMWNFKMRWVGEGRVERCSTVFSQPGDGKFVPLVQDQWTATPLGNLEGKPATEGDGIEWMVLNEVVRPAARTGEIILVHYSQTNTPSARVTQHVWLLKAATALDRPPVHPREPRRNS